MATIKTLIFATDDPDHDFPVDAEDFNNDEERAYDDILERLHERGRSFIFTQKGASRR